jgi:hypothetical protein
LRLFAFEAGRVQQQGVQRAHAMNQGRGRDLVPGI